jgi:hypothetical protein
VGQVSEFSRTDNTDPVSCVLVSWNDDSAQFWYIVMKLLHCLCTTSGKLCTSGLFQDGTNVFVILLSGDVPMTSSKFFYKTPNVPSWLEFQKF